MAFQVIFEPLCIIIILITERDVELSAKLNRSNSNKTEPCTRRSLRFSVNAKLQYTITRSLRAVFRAYLLKESN